MFSTPSDMYMYAYMYMLHTLHLSKTSFLLTYIHAHANIYDLCPLPFVALFKYVHIPATVCIGYNSMIEGASGVGSLLAAVLLLLLPFAYTCFFLGLKASLWKLSLEMSTDVRSE